MFFIGLGAVHLEGSGCQPLRSRRTRFFFFWGGGGTSPSQGEASFLLPHLRSASMCRRQRRKTGMKRQMERSSIRSEATLLTTDNMDFLLSAMSSVELHGKVGRSFYRGRPHGRLYVGPTDEWASVCGTDGGHHHHHHLATLPQHGTGTSLYCTAQHSTAPHRTVRASDSQEASFLLLPQILLLSSPLRRCCCRCRCRRSCSLLAVAFLLCHFHCCSLFSQKLLSAEPRK